MSEQDLKAVREYAESQLQRSRSERAAAEVQAKAAADMLKAAEKMLVEAKNRAVLAERMMKLLLGDA